MEVIKKIVNIRDFIEKFGGKEPYLHSAASDTNATSYGKVPYDILVDLNNNEALSPLPKYCTNSSGTFYGEVALEEEANYGVKFGTFAYYYSWLRKFIMESEFYACGQRKNNAVWVETAATETFNVRRNIFASAKGVFGGLPNAEDYTCGEDIVCISESADTFYNMFSEGIQDATAFLNYAVASVITGHYPTLSPFLELPLLVDRDIDDLGYEYMAFPEEWKSGVTYNSGVSVTHEGYIYQRIASSGSETTFDTDKWLKLVTTDSSYSEPGKTYFMESQLKTLTRQKRLLDVDGNEVEFVSGSTCGHELKYVVNVPQNIVYNEELGTYTYNCMYSITRYDAMGDEAPLYDFNKNNIGQKGRIKFVYYVNCFTDSSDTEISSVPCNGVKYTEEYDYEIALSPVIKISAFAETEAYLKIDYTSGYMPEWGESGKTYAKVELETTNEEWLSANTFIRYDTVIGTTDVSFTSNEVRIDRGASASYEALNVIGEVNTIEDIEKYRNDWFRIKGKND